MKVTIQQIADAVGVSRGTVDRALNDRGRINPEVEKRIKQKAQEMGYVHKKQKHAHKRKIGVVTQLSKSSFMLEINRGITESCRELKRKGIEILLKEGKGVDEQEQLKAICELEVEGIDGLALMPVESENIRTKLNEIIETKNIPVVTFNSDIVGTKRSCFVGMDNQQSGRAAAGLLGVLTRGKGKILVITGHFGNAVNNMRVDGFIDELKRSYPKLELAGVHGSFDNAVEVERIIENAIQTVPEITGVLVVSGGQQGVAEAYKKLCLEKRPYTVIYDLTPRNRKLLEEGMVDFLIDQNGYVQGSKPLYILADMMSRNIKVEEEFYYTSIDIRNKYNI